MDRTEQAGLGLSVAGHAALFAILSIGLFAATTPVVAPPPAIEVALVDIVAPVTRNPEPSPLPPTPRVARAAGPPREAAPPVAAQPPAAAPRGPVAPTPVTPAPPQPATVRPKAAAAKPVAADTRPRRRPGLDRSLLAGLTERPGAPTVRPTTAVAPAAAARAPIGAAQQAALGRVIREQLKPHWKAPTGADAEQLRTELRVTLARDGSVTDVRVIQTTGVNDSNRAQVRLHQEAAMKAVRLAAPFTGLPAEYYEYWSTLETVGFDRRLSQ